MSRMSKTYCCYIDLDDTDFDSTFMEFQAASAYNIRTNGILPTINIMKEHSECTGGIQNIRAKLYKYFPLRPNPCPYGSLRCCGSCIRSCGNRCAMDAYNKCCQVLLHGMTLEGRLDVSKLHLNNLYVKIIYDTLSNPETTYYKLVSTAASIITKETNPQVAKLLSMYENSYDNRLNHPFSYDYSPESLKWVNPKTGKIRRVVDSNGYIQFKEYPKSGLCAYCMPRTTVDRSSMTLRERKNLNSSFLK